MRRGPSWLLRARESPMLPSWPLVSIVTQKFWQIYLFSRFTKKKNTNSSSTLCFPLQSKLFKLCPLILITVFFSFSVVRFLLICLFAICKIVHSIFKTVFFIYILHDFISLFLFRLICVECQNPLIDSLGSFMCVDWKIDGKKENEMSIDFVFQMKLFIKDLL